VFHPVIQQPSSSASSSSCTTIFRFLLFSTAFLGIFVGVVSGDVSRDPFRDVSTDSSSVSTPSAPAPNPFHPSPAVFATRYGLISALNHLSPLVVLLEPPSSAESAALVVRMRLDPWPEAALPPSLTRVLSLSRCFWRCES